MPSLRTLRDQCLPAEGFTLTELAVVLVIVSFLIGGLLVPLSAQIDIRNTRDTRAALSEIREALLGFAVANGRLPCPAPPTTASGAAGAGLEVAPGPAGCGVGNLAGVLPWATLGVEENDPWGRRYSYRVTRAFTAPPSAGATAGFTLSPAGGDLTMLPAAGSPAIVAANVPAVVISHGKNGNGAYISLGTQLPVGADADELENQILNNAPGLWMDGGVVTVFVKRAAPTVTADDEVVWISQGVLFNRMISGGKPPPLP